MRDLPAGILVLSAQRDLRRQVFDALDLAGCQHVHCARDVAHAAILLDGVDSLALVVVVFSGDQGQAMASCEQLRRVAQAARAPMMAVLSGDASFDGTGMPDEVIDWVHAARIHDELVPRWRRLQARDLASTRQAREHDAVGDPDYRFLLDEGDVEWLIVAAESGRVLETSVAVVRHSHLPEEYWQDRLLVEAVQFNGVAVEQVLAERNRRWYPCQRRTAQGADAGQASVFAIRHGGDDALALLFRPDLLDVSAASGLSLLSRLFASPGGADAQAAAGQLLFDELGLDFLAIWSVRPDSSDAPVQMLQLWNGQTRVWPPASMQTSLQQVLGGKSMVCLSDARHLAQVDPLLQQLELAGFCGIPLLDERQSVLGAMLAGSCHGFADTQIIEPILRCAAARFAQVLELARTREEGRAEGLVDGLTGLPNRLLFSDRLDTIIREAIRNGECFAVLFVDIDHFKTINDTYGHAAGDQVLRVVTQRLRSSIRASDTVGRHAGDEFTVALRHIVKSDDVSRVAEKIVQIMQAPMYLADGTELRVTASMGLSFFPDDAGDTETLLKHADEAMYAAKRLGRNNCQVYEMDPEYAQEHGLALRTRLRHAERNDELRVVYQPQIDASSEEVVGMEALVRWEHPDLGLVSPAVFIPLAEESGLIVSIGEWVLRTACRQAMEWEQRYGLRLRLGVNLSAVQLMEPQLVDTIADVLRESGLDPTLLELEITESISIKAAPNLIENLNALHKLGCHVAIDDFGTGAASLDYLRRLPADRIKIDQSFVRNIGVDPDDEAIVRATIEMAHRLKRAVVAEGVETEQHLLFLRAHHCDELQGYLFCRPLQPVSFDKLLGERQRLLDAQRAEMA